MAPLSVIEKPKSHKGRKVLLSREPKLIENQRRTVFLKGSHTSQMTLQVLTDWHHLKKPEAIFHSRNRHEVFPFEDPTPIEKICRRNDASLFTLARHSKKKPNSLVCGRLYDGNVLDIFEFLIQDVKPLSNFLSTLPEGRGNKPLLTFLGDEFEKNKTTSRIKNFLIDYFRGNVIDKLSLQGVKYVISFFLCGEVITMRPYSIQLMKSGVSTPRVELTESGPQVVMKLTRSQLATDDLYQAALRKPKELMAKKQKNISRDDFNSKLGRVHMEKQDFTKLQLRKVKVYKHLDEPNAGLPEEAQEKLKWKSDGYESADVILDSDDERK